MFDRVGVGEVELVKEDGSEVDRDGLFEAALEGGAVDVEFPEDEEAEEGGPKPFSLIYCEMEGLGQLRDHLVRAGYPPRLCELTWRPKDSSSNVTVQEADAENFENLLEALDDNDDIFNVYHNAV